MANEETAFFRFDTNLNQVVSDIEGGMRRINSALSQGGKFDQGTLARDTASIGQAMGRLQSDLEGHVGKIQSLLGQVGSGAISKEQFSQQFAETVRGAVRTIPDVLAHELSLSPETTAKRLNAKAIAQSVAQDYVSQLTRAFRDGRPAVEEALKGLRVDPRTFNADIARVAKNPVNYGAESPDNRLTQLINRARAQQLLAEHYTATQLPFGASSDRFPTVAAAQNSGFASLMKQMEADAALQGRLQVGDEGIHFRPDKNIVTELQEEIRRVRQLGTESERTAAAVAQLAEAEKALSAARSVRLGSGFVGNLETGEVTKLQGVGKQAADARQAEAQLEALARDQEHYKRLQAEINAGNAVRTGSGTYALRDSASAFQLSGSDTARRIPEGIQLNEVIRQRNLLLEKEEAELRRVAAAAEKANAAGSSQGDGGFVGGALDRLHRGDHSFAANLGAQVVSAGLFSVAYGSLFAIQGVMRDTLKEFQEYQEALTDLEVATRDTGAVTDDFVHSLGEFARISGANPGVAAATASRGIRAFGAGIDDPGALQAVGEATASSAAKLSLIANKGLQDATGDLVAAGSAFGLGPDQLNQIVDAVANAKRNVGGDAGQISQGLALIAGAAQEAGFDLNEAASIIGLVQARTDQSGQAIATRLTRIFQIINGSTGRNLARELGLDPNAPTKELLLGKKDAKGNTTAEGFAQKFVNGDEQTRDRITSALGGTANLRELLPLLKENETLSRAFSEAIKNAGQGEDEVNRKTTNLVGTLRKLRADLSAIQVELAKSGLFAPLGAAVRALEPALHGFDELLQIYNKLPEPLKDTLGVLLDIVAASKLISVLGAGKAAKLLGVAGVGQVATTGATLGAVGAGTTAAAGAAAATAAAASNAATAAALGTVTTGGVFLQATEVGTSTAALRMASTVAATDIYAAGALAAGAIESSAVATTAARAAAEAASSANVEGWALRRGVAEASLTGVVAEATVARGAAEAAGAAGSAAFMGTRMGFASLATTLTSGPVLALAGAVAGLYAFEKFRAGTKQAEELGALPTTTLNGSFSRVDGSDTLQDLRNASSDLRSKIGEVKKTKIGFLGVPEAKDIALSRLRDDKSVLGDIIDKVEKEQAALAKVANQGVFGAGPITTINQLAAGINNLTEAGANGITQMRALTKAINSTDSDTRPFADPATTGARLAATLGPKFAGFVPKGGLTIKEVEGYYRPDGSGIDWKFVNEKLSKDRVLDRATPGARDAADLQKKVEELFAQRGIKPGERLDRVELDKIVQEAAASLAFDAIPKAKDKERLRNLYLKAFRKTLGLDQITPQERLLSGKGALSPDQFKTLWEPQQGKEGEVVYGGLDAMIQASERDVPKSDNGQILGRLKKANLRFLETLRKRLGDDAPQDFLLYLENYRHDTQEVIINHLEDLRRAAQNKPGLSRIRIRNIGRGFLLKEIRDAGHDRQLIASIMDRADRASINYVLQQLRTAALVEAKARRFSQRLLQLATIIPIQISGDLKGPAEQAYAAAQEGANQANVHATDSVYSTGSDTANYEAPKEPKKPKEGKSHEELRAERKRYLDALDQLKGDLTDPVENAIDALRAARRAVRFATSKVDRTEAKVDVRRAQAELEAAKFSQRLSDVQTAEQLGRISHQAYIRYLENEHDRLSRIQKRTRQQQDQLNEIDLALKEANESAQGQFNLGEINVNGLVYQSRRLQAESRAAQAQSSVNHAQNSSVQNITIAINGADTHMVKRTIDEYLRISPNQTRTLQRRKS